VIGIIVTHKRELTGLGIEIRAAIPTCVKILFDFPVGIEGSE
jgi:hypothetical protein